MNSEKNLILLTVSKASLAQKIRIELERLWSVPFAYWSRPRHIGLAVLIVMMVVAFCFVCSKHEDNLLTQAQSSLSAAQHRNLLHSTSHSGVISTSSVQRLLNTLPSSSIVDALQADISRFAESNRLQLVSLATEHASVADPDTPRIVLQVSVRGDYAGIKSWLSELLARYPTLSLQQLEIQNVSQDPSSGQRQEARVILVLYVRAH